MRYVGKLCHRGPPLAVVVAGVRRIGKVHPVGDDVVAGQPRDAAGERVGGEQQKGRLAAVSGLCADPRYDGPAVALADSPTPARS